MNWLVKIFIFVLLCSSIVFSQEPTREQKLKKIDELNNQIKSLETEVLLPTDDDLKQSGKDGLEVFRIMPRERYDHKLTVQGGGSYYSFTTKSHDYQEIPQIGLEQNYLKVGFAGADYGFFADLGNTSLEGVTSESSEISFLINYKPPSKESEVRSEAMKAYQYETQTSTYRRHINVNIGHTYVLRAISFGNADVLVAFKIHRKDADGSLIIFWKLLENFDKPLLSKN